ncbi:MAG: hypothetical protein NVSMB52_07370 [Chloroflexota bacterium]
MIVHAELGCLNCGYDLGDVEGRRGAPLKDLVFLPTHQGDYLELDGKGHFLCPRCKGRVLPQGVAPVKYPLDRNTIGEAEIGNSVTRGLMY